MELSLSLNKCVLLQIGYCDVSVSYYLSPNILKTVSSYTDLGVNISASLKASLHCTQIAKKASARAKLILKCFLSKSTLNFVRAFKTYVRPLLEYACPVWNPNLLCDINLIENVQRVFTRKVFILCNMPVLSYDKRLRILGLERLELRRLHFDLIELFKIVKHFTDSSIYLFCHLII